MAIRSTDSHFCKPFLDYMERTVMLDQTAKTLIAAQSRLVTFSKGDTLLDAGSICKYVYFLLSGEAISYFDNFRGKTTTFFFHFNLPYGAVKNVFAVDYKSFLSAQPASITITAASATKAIRFSKQDVDLLIDGLPLFERWIRILDEMVYSAMFERVFSLLTLSASDRYAKFLREEPYLLNLFSNYHIASYLGIAPQSLSRIRKTINDQQGV
jgi:CRP-like cAMP-binding protein